MVLRLNLKKLVFQLGDLSSILTDVNFKIKPNSITAISGSLELVKVF